MGEAKTGPLRLKYDRSAKLVSKPCRVVAKVAFHPCELFRTVGFIVTDCGLSNERVLAF